MPETMPKAEIKSAARLLRGPLLTAAASLVLAGACLMDWADVQVVVFHRSYSGMHFGEGHVTLGLAVAGTLAAIASVLWLSRVAYLLPLIATPALALTTRKYHEVGRAFSSFHGFRLAHASAGDGLLLAVVASAALLAASLLAVADCLRRESWPSRTASEVQ
jgi:hypothetical protein